VSQTQESRSASPRSETPHLVEQRVPRSRKAADVRRRAAVCERGGCATADSSRIAGRATKADRGLSEVARLTRLSGWPRSCNLRVCPERILARAHRSSARHGNTVRPPLRFQPSLDGAQTPGRWRHPLRHRPRRLERSLQRLHRRRGPERRSTAGPSGLTRITSKGEVS